MRFLFCSVTVVAVLNLCTPLLATGQGVSAFGKCEWWKEQATKVNDAAGALELYRVGYAHGFAHGGGASLVAYFFPLNPEGVPALKPLWPFADSGFTKVLQRPAVLVEAFDKHCADYRNDSISLVDIGVLAVLEIGGIEEARVAEALRVLRMNQPVETRRLRVFRALTQSGQ